MEGRIPVVVGVGRVAVLHLQQELGQALLVQAQRLDQPLPLHHAERQARQWSPLCDL